jgi:hypothetical protein
MWWVAQQECGVAQRPYLRKIGLRFESCSTAVRTNGKVLPTVQKVLSQCGITPIYKNIYNYTVGLLFAPTLNMLRSTIIPYYDYELVVFVESNSNAVLL